MSLLPPLEEGFSVEAPQQKTLNLKEHTYCQAGTAVANRHNDPTSAAIKTLEVLFLSS